MSEDDHKSSPFRVLAFHIHGFFSSFWAWISPMGLYLKTKYETSDEDPVRVRGERRVRKISLATRPIHSIGSHVNERQREPRPSFINIRE